MNFPRMLLTENIPYVGFPGTFFLFPPNLLYTLFNSISISYSALIPCLLTTLVVVLSTYHQFICRLLDFSESCCICECEETSFGKNFNLYQQQTESHRMQNICIFNKHSLHMPLVMLWGSWLSKPQPNIAQLLRASKISFS